MGRRKILPVMPDGSGLSVAPLPGVPLVEICNSKRVLIENHQGVAAYRDDEIIVKVRSGRICVGGENLQLVRMSKYQLVITGNVSEVQFQEIC